MWLISLQIFITLYYSVTSIDWWQRCTVHSSSEKLYRWLDDLFVLLGWFLFAPGYFKYTVGRPTFNLHSMITFGQVVKWTNYCVLFYVKKEPTTFLYLEVIKVLNGYYSLPKTNECKHLSPLIVCETRELSQ